FFFADRVTNVGRREDVNQDKLRQQEYVKEILGESSQLLWSRRSHFERLCETSVTQIQEAQEDQGKYRAEHDVARAPGDADKVVRQHGAEQSHRITGPMRNEVASLIENCQLPIYN